MQESIEKLGKFLMIQYSLTNDFFQEFDFSLKEVQLVKECLDKMQEIYSPDDILPALENALDEYIKNNDWTGYFGSVGSGNRERGFIIEGCLEYTLRYI